MDAASALVPDAHQEEAPLASTSQAEQKVFFGAQRKREMPMIKVVPGALYRKTKLRRCHSKPLRNARKIERGHVDAKRLAAGDRAVQAGVRNIERGSSLIRRA